MIIENRTYRLKNGDSVIFRTFKITIRGMMKGADRFYKSVSPQQRKNVPFTTRVEYTNTRQTSYMYNKNGKLIAKHSLKLPKGGLNSLRKHFERQIKK